MKLSTWDTESEQAKALEIAFKHILNKIKENKYIELEEGDGICYHSNYGFFGEVFPLSFNTMAIKTHENKVMYVTTIIDIEDIDIIDILASDSLETLASESLGKFIGLIEDWYMIEIIDI